MSEIVVLDVSDVKIQSGQRGVMQERLDKGRKSRSIPLNATVIIALKAWLKLRLAAGTALFLSRSNIRSQRARRRKQIVVVIAKRNGAAAIDVYPICFLMIANYSTIVLSFLAWL